MILSLYNNHMKATIISERYDNDMISTYSYKQYIIECYKLCPPPPQRKKKKK